MTNTGEKAALLRQRPAVRNHGISIHLQFVVIMESHRFTAHYPFVQHIIERLAAEAGHPDLMVIDTGGAIARQLEHVLQDHGLLCKGTPETAPADFQIFTSGDAGKTRNIVKRLLSMDVPVRQALF